MITVSARCPNCETDLSPNTVIVYEAQESIRTYSCRKCGTSLKAEDLTKSGRPEPEL